MKSLDCVGLQSRLGTLQPNPLGLKFFDGGIGLFLKLQSRVHGPLLQVREFLNLLGQSMLRALSRLAETVLALGLSELTRKDDLNLGICAAIGALVGVDGHSVSA